MATAHLRAVLEGFDQAKRELADVGKSVDELSEKKVNVGDSANDGTVAIKGLGEAAELSASQLAMIGAAAAAATAAAVYLGKEIYDQVRAVADLGDQYNELRQTTGLQVETLSGLSLAFQTNGMSIEAGAKTIERFNKNIYEAQNGNKETARTFQTLGIEIDSFRNDTEGALLAVAERFSKMEDGAAKTALAMELFGRGGAKMIPFLNEGAEGLAKLRREAEQAGIVMSTETAKAGDELNDALAVLNANVKGFWQEMATPMMVSLAGIATAMRNAKIEGEGFFGVLQAGLVTMARLTIFGSEQGQLEDAQKKLQAVRANIGRYMATGDTGALRQAEAEEADLVARVQRLRAFTDPTLNNTPKEVAPALAAKEGKAAKPSRAAAVKDEEEEAFKVLESMSKRRVAIGELELEDIAYMYEERLLIVQGNAKKTEETELRLAEVNEQIRKRDQKAAEEAAKDDLRRFAAQEKAFQQVEDAATKSFEKRQKESAQTADAEIKDINSVVQYYRGDKIRALEQLERKYHDAGMEGSEALKKVQGALRDAKNDNDKLVAGATTLKSALGQLGFDTLAIIQGSMRGAQKEISEVLKGHQSLGEAAKNIWKGISNAAIDELSRIVVNEGFKAVMSFFRGDGIDLSWISKAGNAISSLFSGGAKGSVGSGALGTAATAGNVASGAGGLSNLGSAANLLWGGFGGGVGSIGAGGAVMTAAPVYEAGALIAGAETASLASGAGMSAMLSAIGPVGWAAIAAGAFLAFNDEEDERKGSSIKLYEQGGIFKLDVGDISDAGGSQSEFESGPAAGLSAMLNDPTQYNPAILRRMVGEYGLGGPSDSASALSYLQSVISPAKYAIGTDQLVTSPKLVMVGENGPERLQVTPMAGAGSGGGGSMTVNVNGFSMMDNYSARRFARELQRRM